MLDCLDACQKDRLEALSLFFETRFPQARLYLVGGSVRDMVMRHRPKDLDLEVFGLDEDRFKKAMEQLGACGVGKSFFVYRYREVDIALPRCEIKTGEGHRAFSVRPAHTTLEASRRRDFTMNALMFDLATGEIVDHWDGVADIRKRVIRVVHPQSFTEDSLRVLRAMQFAARFDFRIDVQSAALMRAIALDDLSAERIAWEFEKMFLSAFPWVGLYYLCTLQIASKVLAIDIPRPLFLKTALRMRHAQARPLHGLEEYRFLYLLATTLHLPFSRILSRLGLPGRYRRRFKFQPAVPRRISERFLLGIALTMPVREWLGHDHGDVAGRAKALGVFDRVYDAGVTPTMLLAEGYSGRALGIELRQRRLEAIRNHFPLKEGYEPEQHHSH